MARLIDVLRIFYPMRERAKGSYRNTENWRDTCSKKCNILIAFDGINVRVFTSI
jgi:hypothetical protein